MLHRQVPDQIARVDVPHLDLLVQPPAEDGAIVLEQQNRPNEIGVASQGF